jgi:hypothetical protein
MKVADTKWLSKHQRQVLRWRDEDDYERRYVVVLWDQGPYKPFLRLGFVNRKHNMFWVPVVQQVDAELRPLEEVDFPGKGVRAVVEWHKSNNFANAIVLDGDSDDT